MDQGTVVEGTIQQLFEGHHMNYIECINVDYKSTRKESFYGMQSRLVFFTTFHEFLDLMQFLTFDYRSSARCQRMSGRV